MLGAVLHRLGRKSEAAAANQSAVVVSPYDATAHCNLGVIQQELGRFDDAVASYSQALSLKRNYLIAQKNLIDLLAVHTHHGKSSEPIVKVDQ